MSDEGLQAQKQALELRRQGDRNKEISYLLSVYPTHLNNHYIMHRLKELGEIYDEMLLAKPQTIFECEWREGFGATFHMLCTRLEYCLKQKMYLSIPSPLGFGPWEKFFKPFWTPTEKERIYKTVKTITKTQPRLSIYRDHVNGYHKRNGTNLFLKGSYRYILKRFFRLQPHIQEQAEALIKKLNLPENYIAVHIRRGDRFTHRSCPCKVQIQEYLTAIKKFNPTVNSIFVATDDIAIIDEMSKHINVISLTTSKQKGFNDPVFFRTPHHEKVDEFIQLFTEIEIASRAKYFVGTYCSVLSHLMQSQHGIENSTLLF